MVICFHDYTWVGSTYNREFFIITSFSNWSGKKIRTKLCNILASHHITANKPGISHPTKTNCHAFNQSKSSRDWILPRLTAVKTFSRTRHWLHLIPRLTLAIFSPTLVGTCMFVRVWHRKHFIPLFAEVASFSAFDNSCTFSRSSEQLAVFPRLTVACFLSITASCTFSRSCEQLPVFRVRQLSHVFPRLLAVHVYLRSLQEDCFPALVTHCMLSRARHGKHVFPRLLPEALS